MGLKGYTNPWKDDKCYRCKVKVSYGRMAPITTTSRYYHKLFIVDTRYHMQLETVSRGQAETQVIAF